jgi:hypothetical protein
MKEGKVDILAISHPAIGYRFKRLISGTLI